LVLYVRDLIVVAESADVALASVSASFRAKLTDQSRQWGLRTALAALHVLSDTKAKMQRVTFERALAESAIVRMTLLGELDAIAAWMAGKPPAGPSKAAVTRTIEPVQRDVKSPNSASPQATSSIDQSRAGRETSPSQPDNPQSAHRDPPRRTKKSNCRPFSRSN
jgi:DNA polymerase III gamma/tau subunit